MRWFIALLLVANVILFFWVQQQSKPASNAAALPPPEHGRLRLIHEIDAPEPVMAAPAPSPAPLDTPTESPLAAIPGSAEDGPPASAPTIATAAETPAGGTGVDDATTGAPDPSPADPEPVAASQQGSALEAEAEAEAAEPPPVVPTGPDHGAEPSAVAVCVRVGPLDPEAADGLLARLPADMELLSDTREEYAQEDGYFVLIPPLASLSEGLQRLRELEAAGIKDTWLFRGGELRNAISLGVYSNEAGARRHAERVASKGFTNAEVRGKTTSAERRWLTLKNTRGDGPEDALPLPEGVVATPQPCP